jgi:hypothetical protein
MPAGPKQGYCPPHSGGPLPLGPPDQVGDEEPAVALATARQRVRQLDAAPRLELLRTEPHQATCRRDIRQDGIDFRSKYVRSRTPPLVKWSVEALAVIQHQVTPTVPRRPTGHPALLERSLENVQERQFALLRGG